MKDYAHSNRKHVKITKFSDKCTCDMSFESY